METKDIAKLKRSAAGRKGALARMLKYGNPGTFLGRIKGGRNSILSQIKLGANSPFVAKEMKIPVYSCDLAEFVGILLGDGCINPYQISISLNRSRDAKYADYVTLLINKLFDISPSVFTRKSSDVIIILISRINVVKYLRSIGLTNGNKVQLQVGVPLWVKMDYEYSKKCVRGLIDTDGCMYIDKHRINHRLYRNLGLNFTNRSSPLLEFVKSMWIKSGYHPTTNGPFSIFMRKKNEIIDYMKNFGSSNPKIGELYTDFILEHGRVPKRS